MAKQTEFEHPPGRHVGLLAHDDVADKWYAVSSDADGHLQVDLLTSALPTGAATSARQDTMITALQLIDDLRAALGSVNTDDLQVDVKTSALPTGAATAARQDTMITALQLIDDLRNALESVATDQFQVKVTSSALPSGAASSVNQVSINTGVNNLLTELQLIDDLRAALADVATDELRVNVIAELPAGVQNIGDVDVLTMPTTTVQAAGGDKLLSFESIVEGAYSDTTLDTGVNTLIGASVGTGKVWKITTICVMYSGTPPNELQVFIFDLASNLYLMDEKSVVSGQWYIWEGEVYLAANDNVRLTMSGATLNDDAYLRYAGVQMDAP